MSRFLTALRVAFGLVFVAASLDKIIDPQGFVVVVANYQILPDYLVNATALWLPWLEMVCGLALVAGVMTRGAAVTLSGLTAVFMAVLGYNVWRGLDVACGCFSVDGGETMSQALWRDAVLAAVAVLVLWHVFRKRNPAPESAPAKER